MRNYQKPVLEEKKTSFFEVVNMSSGDEKKCSKGKSQVTPDCKKHCEKCVSEYTSCLEGIPPKKKYR